MISPSACRCARPLQLVAAGRQRPLVGEIDQLASLAHDRGQARVRPAGRAGQDQDDPLDPAPPTAARQTFAALKHLDEAVTGAGGIVLRYGNFYGDPGDRWPDIIRARKFPVAGDGAGIWSHIHLHDAAAATVLALNRDGPAVYNIADDDPAPSGYGCPSWRKSPTPGRRGISPA